MEAETAKTAALEAAAMEADTAKTAALEAAAMEAETAKTAALEAAAMEAETAKTAALEAAAMEAETAKTAALEAAAMEAETAKTAALADAKTAADAALKMVQDELDGLKIDTADAMAAAALVGKIARAGHVHTAIDADPGGIVPKMMPLNSGGGVSGVTAKRNAAGMVTVDVNGTDDDDYAGGETNADSSAWNSVTMTKTNANDSTDMVVIYTDIEAPSDVPIKTRYTTVDGTISVGPSPYVRYPYRCCVLERRQSDGFPSDSPGDTWALRSGRTGKNGSRHF